MSGNNNKKKNSDSDDNTYNNNEINSGPKITNEEWAKYFIKNILGPYTEDLLGGNSSISMEAHIRKIRTEYIVTCGVPTDPIGLHNKIYQQ